LTSYLSTRKKKEERRKSNRIIVTSLLKIFRSRRISQLNLSLIDWTIISLVIHSPFDKEKTNARNRKTSRNIEKEIFLRFAFFVKKEKQEINNNLSEKKILNLSYRGRKNEERERKKMTIGRSLIQLSVR
jgi:hypothetical protein